MNKNKLKNPVLIASVSFCVAILACICFTTSNGLSRTVENYPAKIAHQLNCEDTDNVYEANKCYDAADEQLNQIYSQVISSIGGGQRRQKLIKAELAWINYRDTNCRFRISEFDGSMARQFYSVCLRRMTIQRSEELREFIRN